VHAERRAGAARECLQGSQSVGRAVLVATGERLGPLATESRRGSPSRKLAERVAQETGAKIVRAASAVGAVKGTDNYFDAIDYNVRALAQGLQ
jgi:hypothetical protein